MRLNSRASGSTCSHSDTCEVLARSARSSHWIAGRAGVVGMRPSSRQEGATAAGMAPLLLVRASMAQAVAPAIAAAPLGAGIAPSCCIMPTMSIRTQFSTS